MKLEYILFIVLSAFLHAFYNFFMRKSVGSRTFLTCMFIVSAAAAVVYLAVVGVGHPIPWHFLPFVFLAALFYTAYQVFVSKSYEKGDISKYYPLTVLSPIFIPLWAGLLLAERVSFLTGTGICVTIVGAITVKLNRFTWTEFKKMFRFGKDYAGARYALGASLIYSVGSVMDKARIASFSLPVYMAILLVFMALLEVGYSRFVEKETLLPYFASHWKSITAAGVVVFLSFITFRIALRVLPVTIAVPVRQVAIVFAILLGVLVLKEKFRLSSMIGSVIIILGIILVNLGY